MTWKELAEQVEEHFRAPRFSVHMEVERWRDYRGGVDVAAESARIDAAN